MRSPDELTTIFRENQRKITPQRLAVFDALYNDDSHPTAEVIWDRVKQDMPNVSLRTVYQVLNDLVEFDEVRLVSVDTGASRFDPNVTAHHHFVCRGCQSIYDVEASQPRLVEKTVPAESAGHTVEATEIIFRGLCATCAPQEQFHSTYPHPK